ncbi:hypothetical protein BRC87_13860 [Halobacteriales archaeon QS_4_66_20]|nr:MAG: hypothetical protein BRC87_13860 [Halobacteriales archaeon QS_4_66_20]
MTSIGLGVTVFERTKKLSNLLSSISANSLISTVYIGDNGRLTDEKRSLYATEFPFELEVVNLEFDAGLAQSRKAVVEESDDDFFLVVDNDVKIPHNVSNLLTILQEQQELGGVGGILIENGRIRSDCYDLHERGPLLLKDIREDKPIRSVDGHPLVQFDQIQNVTMYRRECLEDYCWDPEYVIGWEHTDFFLGHKKKTNWEFGVCPEVMFRHYPGGNTDYISKRRSHHRIRQTKKYFLDKWGYEQVLNGQTNWLESHDGLPPTEAPASELGKQGLLALPTGLQVHLMNLRDSVRKLRGEPPF